MSSLAKTYKNNYVLDFFVSFKRYKLILCYTNQTHARSYGTLISLQAYLYKIKKKEINMYTHKLLSNSLAI